VPLLQRLPPWRRHRRWPSCRQDVCCCRQGPSPPSALSLEDCRDSGLALQRQPQLGPLLFVHLWPWQHPPQALAPAAVAPPQGHSHHRCRSAGSLTCKRSVLTVTADIHKRPASAQPTQPKRWSGMHSGQQPRAGPQVGLGGTLCWVIHAGRSSSSSSLDISKVLRLLAAVAPNSGWRRGDGADFQFKLTL